MAGQAEQWEAHIDGMVRDILARLDSAERPAEAAASRSAIATHQTNRVAKRSRPAGLVLGDAVVTLASLEARLDGVRQVTVRPTAIVTPAVRDALRERGIVLSRDGDAVGSDEPAASGIVLGVAACAPEPVSPRRLQEVLGVDVELLARVGFVDVVREISDQVALGGRMGILFTTETAAAVCLANRRRGVRAVTARDPAEAARSSASVGANLLVLRPEGCSTWTQLRMAQEFLNYKANCPAEYADALH